MRDFSDKLMNDVQHAILSQVKNAEYVQIQHSDRRPLPPTFLEDLWAQVDWQAVLDEVKPKMHIRICNSIIGAMEQEVKTDVKKLLSISGVRQKLRVEVYPKLMEVLEEN